MKDWEIQSGAHQCKRSGRAFVEGDVVHCRLLHTKEGYVREDFAPEAWEEGFKEDAVSVWKRDYCPPPPKKEEPLDPHDAEGNLRVLMDKQDPELTNTIFVLAVLLERKRALIQRAKELQDDGALFRVYEHKDTGEMFTIKDPQLSLDETLHVQTEVALTLGWGAPEEVVEEHEKKMEGEVDKMKESSQSNVL